jgi:hypothetical protein
MRTPSAQIAANIIGHLDGSVAKPFPPSAAPCGPAGTEMRKLQCGDQSASNGATAALRSATKQTKCRTAASRLRNKRRKIIPAMSKTVDFAATEIR